VYLISFPDFNPLSKKYLPDNGIANKELPRLLRCHAFEDFGNQDWHSVFATPLDGNPEALKPKIYKNKFGQVKIGYGSVYQLKMTPEFII
jgi:hypothetical protein